MIKFTLEQFKENYFKKFAKSKLKILKVLIGDIVIVEDYYGLCKITRNNLMKGSIPNIKSSINKELYFKNLLKQKYNYDFDIFKYKNANNILILNCYGLHKITSTSLFNGSKLTINSAINKEEYLTNQIKEKFPENLEHYEIIKYNNTNNILIKNKFGECIVNSTSLLKGSLPSIQTAINKTEYFINKCKQISNNNNYSYNKTIYEKDHLKVIITCVLHGDFKVTPNCFLNKTFCAKCGYLNSSLKHSLNPNGWNKTNWFNSALKSKNFDSFKVYIIKGYNKTEQFYKIGRTFQKVEKRFYNMKVMSYNYKIIKIYEFKELTQQNSNLCYDLENQLKKEHKEFKYLPKIKFAGREECFYDLINYSNLI